jgi:hypothetical protein
MEWKEYLEDVRNDSKENAVLSIKRKVRGLFEELYDISDLACFVLEGEAVLCLNGIVSELLDWLDKWGEK